MSEVQEVTQTSNGVADVESQPAFSKDSWLKGPKLAQDTIWVDSLNDAITVRELTVGEQARISNECLRVKGDTITTDHQRSVVLKIAAAAVNPKFSKEEANVIVENHGLACSLVIQAIDKLSSADSDALEKAQRRFQSRPRR